MLCAQPTPLAAASPPISCLEPQLLAAISIDSTFHGGLCACKNKVMKSWVIGLLGYWIIGMERVIYGLLLV